MKQKYILILCLGVILVISGCSSSPKYKTPESPWLHQPKVKKNPPQPIPTDILQKYKRIRSITGEIINLEITYAMV